MDQQQQSFTLTDLTGADIEAIMTGLNELPAKASRATMNKIEAKIVEHLQAERMKADAQAAKAARAAQDKAEDAAVKSK